MFILNSGAYVQNAIAGQNAAAAAASAGDISGARERSQQAGFDSSASELAFAAEKEGVNQSKKNFLG